jgi:hypothetical protein
VNEAIKVLDTSQTSTEYTVDGIFCQSSVSRMAVSTFKVTLNKLKSLKLSFGTHMSTVSKRVGQYFEPLKTSIIKKEIQVTTPNTYGV